MFSIMSLQKMIDEKVSKISQYGVKSLQDYTTQELFSLFKSWSRQINHIYWSQKKNALKILNANDRDCYILELDEKPIGILVFKNHPVMEEPSLSSKRGYIELKSFFLFDRFWEGHIWKLWELLFTEITQCYPEIDWIYVSVSKTKARSSLNMFKKMGFLPLYESYNKYLQDWDSEVFLYCPLCVDLLPQERELSISEPYFSQLQDGSKIVEGRSWKSFEKYKIWDSIIFKNKNKVLKKTITNIVKYKTLEDYLDQEGVDNCLPWIDNKEKAIEVYNQIPWYKEKIKKYWIIAFKF